MKRLFIILIGLFLSITVYSQACLPEGIIFSTQYQIDRFQIIYPNCTEIEGSVTISGEDITNLNGLSVITSIGDFLRFYHNDNLSNLSGLENLTSIGGGLEIYYNSGISSLSGLNGLTFIGGHFYVDANPNLNNLTGLEALASIGDYLRIEDNNTLSSLSGLESLVSIGGDLKIGTYTGNPVLNSLAGLENLITIGGSLSVKYNDVLTSLYGLDNIDAGSITELIIRYNNSLSSCEAQSICDYLASPNGIINIGFNAVGCDNPPEIASACGITLPCLPYGIYYFYTQADIDNFQVNYPECSFLEGNVRIDGPDILNLNGLSNITSIGGHLEIYDNYFLTNLNGLDNLISIGGSLSMDFNSSLSSLTGLNSLTSIGDILSITNTTELASLAGLDNIDPSSIAGLRIFDNYLLSACDVQSICDYLASPNGIIQIFDNEGGCNSQAEVESACRVGFEDPEKQESLICIYPNPSFGQITIKTALPLNQGLLQIFSLNGNELGHYQITESKMDIDINNLQAGVYFVKFTSENEVRMFKVVKY